MEGRPPAQRFEDLLVWQRAHALVLQVYRLTAEFPKTETDGLSAQLRRSMVSVPANVAEGFKKRGSADKARYMNIAESSLEESRYYMILGRDLGYHGDQAILGEMDAVGRMLRASGESILRGREASRG